MTRSAKDYWKTLIKSVYAVKMIFYFEIAIIIKPKKKSVVIVGVPQLLSWPPNKLQNNIKWKHFALRLLQVESRRVHELRFVFVSLAFQVFSSNFWCRK